MAPLSRLLVYYVRENGEGVTDSLQISIQPIFENEVRIDAFADRFIEFVFLRGKRLNVIFFVLYCNVSGLVSTILAGL